MKFHISSGLEQIGSLVYCFVSCFFDYGKNFFEFSKELEHCNAALRDCVDFSFSFNDSFLNQFLLNQEAKITLQQRALPCPDIMCAGNFNFRYRIWGKYGEFITLFSLTLTNVGYERSKRTSRFKFKGN
jgi:hypothetical protein